MKYKISYLCIIYAIAFANGEFISKNIVINEELSTQNAYIDKELNGLRKILEMKMTKSMEHLTTIFTENTQQLEKRLNAQLSDKINNFAMRLDLITSLLLGISNKLEYQEQNIRKQSENNLQTTKNMKEGFDILTLQYSNMTNIIEKYSKQACEKEFNTIQNLKNEVNKCAETHNIIEAYKWPTNCKESLQKTNQTGIYEIQLPAFGPEPFKVLCDNEKHDGNWTVVMRRFDGSVGFDRNWSEYKNGFGDLSGEFFIGLEKFYMMTASQGRQDLLIIMTDPWNQIQYILYDNFTLGNENEGYMIKELGKSTGTVTDKLTNRKSVKFSTKDMDNDMAEDWNCADVKSGAGWHHENCTLDFNLFGLYDSYSVISGMRWDTKLTSAEMLIRPHGLT